MFFALIGHRGTGKTTLLARLARYYADAGRPIVTVDLDEELGRRHGFSAGDLLSRVGELTFREHEAAAFADLLQRHAGEGRPDVYVAIGAGFTFALPAQVHAVWVRRPTDGVGRVFLDRPRLDPALLPIDEYRQRFARREPRYAELADDVWELPEGQVEPDDGERLFFLGTLADSPVDITRKVGGVLTVLPPRGARSGRSPAARLVAALTRRLRWPGTRFELRDDLLDAEQRRLALELVPAERILYSFREHRPTEEELRSVSGRLPLWDFPLELGEPPGHSAPPILSLHKQQPGESLAAAAARLERAAVGTQLLKLAPVVETFAELAWGHAWASQDPQHRAFLPRSIARPGRWAWYRLVSMPQQPLPFFREGDGSAADQPALADFLRAVALLDTPAAVPRPFAAVLGDPVGHSRTPLVHSAFFRERGAAVVAIPLSTAEWEAGALAVLQRLGLRWAAVTSPLKGQAARLVGSDGQRYGAVNTLACDPAGWRGTNTDAAGAAALLGPWADEPAVAIWGGGGTLPVVREQLPLATPFAARSGEAREGEGRADFRPRVVVWAVGRSVGAAAPPASWAPAVVVDLNYSDDSPGREYALAVGARYVSGDAWFLRQAAEQQRFWASLASG